MNINRIAAIGEEPLYTPYGYVISENGTIYSLLHQFTHGVILAMLYPDIAEEQGYEAPEEGYDVFHYQQFELDNHDKFPIVRVSISLRGFLNISKGDDCISQEQRESLVKIFSEQGVKLSQKVETDCGEMTAYKALDHLTSHSYSRNVEEASETELIDPFEDPF